MSNAGALALVVLACSGCAGPAAWKLEASGVRVTSVADGDTLTISDSAGFPTVVRLLGINAPEVAHDDQPAQCGAEAAKKALTALTKGRRVTLLTDPGSERTDRFGRLLAYVEVPELGDVAEQLLRRGLAIAWHPARASRPSRSHTYEAEQGIAERTHTGSWARCPNFPG